MTNAAKRLIDSFEALAEQDQRQVLIQLLRRIMDQPYASFTDEELTDAADLVFQEYDHRESQD